jgi:prepilin-type N-terminal cleavage/methylation domain-containing protein
MQQLKQKGFTLIELLVVIAIIGILVAVVFVALDPASRFQQARDAVRQNDVQEVLSAAKLDQVDNSGSYLAAIAAMNAGEVYMVVDGAMVTGCDDNNASCDTNVTDDDNCVSLAGLATEGYLDDVPISPAGAVTWDDGSADGEEGTGYTMQRDATGVLHVRACESEHSSTSEIEAAR